MSMSPRFVMVRFGTDDIRDWNSRSLLGFEVRNVREVGRGVAVEEEGGEWERWEDIFGFCGWY